MDYERDDSSCEGELVVDDPECQKNATKETAWKSPMSDNQENTVSSNHRPSSTDDRTNESDASLEASGEEMRESETANIASADGIAETAEPTEQTYTEGRDSEPVTGHVQAGKGHIQTGTGHVRPGKAYVQAGTGKVHGHVQSGTSQGETDTSPTEDQPGSELDIAAPDEGADTPCIAIMERVDSGEESIQIRVCVKGNLGLLPPKHGKMTEELDQGCQVGLTNHPQNRVLKSPKKSPNTDSQNTPKNPYIDDMKRIERSWVSKTFQNTFTSTRQIIL